MHESHHHTTSFDDLPAEVIPEVASYLDLKDIFSLQQTSKKTRESINVLTVWLALAKTYSRQHFHIYQPQSGGFDDLTEHELHMWIRKRLDFDRIWKTQTLQPRPRILLDLNDYPTLKLVPGGRWLLAGSSGGSVWYCDLDSEEPERKALIQPSEGIRGSNQDIFGLETYTYSDTPELHFNLAIRTKGAIEWLHVWEVKIKDGHSLIAKWLASVPTSPSNGFAYPLAVGRDMVVRTGNVVPNHIVIEIYWWKRCSTTRVLRSRFLAPLGSEAMYLIGDDRILCAEREGGVNLYDIPEPEYISTQQNLELREDVPTPEPIWSFTCSHSGEIYFSPLYDDGTIYRLVVSTNKGIWGFTIPAIKERAPSAIQLSTFLDNRAACVPGLYKAFSFRDVGKSGVRIGYGWESSNDGRAAMTYTRGESTDTPAYMTQPAFDEESGRFLCYRRAKVVVLDFLDTEY